uniref:Uncharacterized protein n=1 Tax=Avena sativa TaxID=4498 RepID=A0ACD5VW32_AVESA
MLRHISALPAPRRPAGGCTVITASRFMEQEALLLRSRGVIIKAVDARQRHSRNPLLVGKKLEDALRIPPHVLHVTRHHPEAFFVKFDNAKHRDAALRLGEIIVDGCDFLLQPWRESDHAVHQTCPLHVRICVERMPLHMWNLEGAKEVLGGHVLVDRLDSRTFRQENTAIFSCWVWCWGLEHIPSSHTFTVFPDGADTISEMFGYSPPSRQVAPPPNGMRYDTLVHLDLVEDSSTPYRRTPSSGQSGLPSSDSEEEEPYPACNPTSGTWRCRMATRHATGQPLTPATPTSTAPAAAMTRVIPPAVAAVSRGRSPLSSGATAVRATQLLHQACMVSATAVARPRATAAAMPVSRPHRRRTLSCLLPCRCLPTGRCWSPLSPRLTLMPSRQPQAPLCLLARPPPTPLTHSRT